VVRFAFAQVGAVQHAPSHTISEYVRSARLLYFSAVPVRPALEDLVAISVPRHLVHSGASPEIVAERGEGACRFVQLIEFIYARPS
jgi:hypothetical protein